MFLIWMGLVSGYPSLLYPHTTFPTGSDITCCVLCLESAKLLHTQLQTLQEFATPSFLTKHMSDSPSRFVWESTAITALGSPEDTGVEGETRKVGMEVLKGSLQAVSDRQITVMRCLS